MTARSRAPRPNAEPVSVSAAAHCIDVLTQISAVQAGLDKVVLGLLDDHAHHSVIAGHGEGEPDELMAAVARAMRRG
jgi:CsoR family transcriptional regulator, copper-sensing transcriptional repressor